MGQPNTLAHPGNNCQRRHCMVVHAYYPAGETRVQREASALVRRGHAVDVICLRESWEPAVESCDGVTVYRMPVQRQKAPSAGALLLEYLDFFARATLKLAKLHSERRYDVVQVHNLPDFLVFAALAPKLGGARVILDLHDLMPEFYAARAGTDLDKWPVRLVALQESIACRFADQVITVTEPWRQALIGRGVPAAKVAVVMNVADDRIFHRSAQVQHNSVNGHFNLVYHGNLSRRYGLDLAVRAVDRVREQIPGVHLLLHGGGEAAPQLRSLVGELHLEEHVTFSTNGVPTTELPSLIRRGDAGIVPYRDDVFTDGILPTKLMEYVALGVPVIASRTSTMLHYFDDSMVQFFTPNDPQDLARCILTLYADRERGRALVESSSQFLRRYNWSDISTQYADLVERVGDRFVAPVRAGGIRVAEKPEQ